MTSKLPDVTKTSGSFWLIGTFYWILLHLVSDFLEITPKTVQNISVQATHAQPVMTPEWHDYAGQTLESSKKTVGDRWRAPDWCFDLAALCQRARILMGD